MRCEGPSESYEAKATLGKTNLPGSESTAYQYSKCWNLGDPLKSTRKLNDESRRTTSRQVKFFRRKSDRLVVVMRLSNVRRAKESTKFESYYRYPYYPQW